MTQRFIWRGPPTTLEIWDARQGAPAWEGFVATDAEIPTELDAEAEQIRNWIAFRLIEPVPTTAAPQSADRPRSRRETQQETSPNG